MTWVQGLKRLDWLDILSDCCLLLIRDTEKGNLKWEKGHEWDKIIRFQTYMDIEGTKKKIKVEYLVNKSLPQHCHITFYLQEKPVIFRRVRSVEGQIAMTLLKYIKYE